jgi:hypothetical protein
MIMPVGLNCGFEFEKGRQLSICLHNKASSVAALCGHNPNWSAFAIRSRHTAAIPSSVAEIFDDDFPVLHVIRFCLLCLRHGNGKVIRTAAMTREAFAIAAIAFVCGTAAATSPQVTFESPCECRDNHGEHRWAVKNDPSTPPVDASAIQAVAPSDVFSWPGASGAFDAKLRAYWDRE